ncbi:cytosolic carboxypeptidase 4 isoform X2 [Arapaima gigas]
MRSSSDAKTVLNVVRLLDELLSAGTERRIHYLISEGGSEALLQALVNTASTGSPDYSVLLPLLNLLAKVGHRAMSWGFWFFPRRVPACHGAVSLPPDRRVGQKAEEVGAVLLTLSLLRRNVDCPRKAVACLRVLRVFCSSRKNPAGPRRPRLCPSTSCSVCQIYYVQYPQFAPLHLTKRSAEGPKRRRANVRGRDDKKQVICCSTVRIKQRATEARKKTADGKTGIKKSGAETFVNFMNFFTN